MAVKGKESDEHNIHIIVVPYIQQGSAAFANFGDNDIVGAAPPRQPFVSWKSCRLTVPAASAGDMVGCLRGSDVLKSINLWMSNHKQIILKVR